MAGAYTAKPGPFYSLHVSGPNTMLAGAGIAVIASFRLNGSSGTIEPANKSITWIATVDGSPVDVRIFSVGSFGSSVTSEVSKSGVHWLSSVTIELEDIGSATEQEVIIYGFGWIEGVSVTDKTIATALGYSLVTAGTSSILSNGTALCTASFRANTTEKTAEPSNKTITWSAVFDGSPVNLRAGGTGGWDTTATNEVIDAGAFWEKISTLSFQVTRPVEDSPLTITGAGEIAGLAVNDSFTTTIRGWPDIEYIMDNDYPYLKDFGVFYLWRTVLEVTVKDIPSNNTDWYKRIRYMLFWDGSSANLSETVEDETGTDPGGISIVFSSDGIDDGPGPWTDAARTLVKVEFQQPNKKYIMKNDNDVGTISLHQSNFSTQIKEASNGNVVDEETRYTEVQPGGMFMQASYINDDVTLVFSGGDWLP